MAADSEVNLDGFIFEKLEPEESGVLSVMTQRQKEEELKEERMNEYENMPLKDKLLNVHKRVCDPDEKVLAQIKYNADPETGKLIREGEVTQGKDDPYEIDEGIEMYNEFYSHPNK